VELSEFARRAAETDRALDQDDGLRIALYGVAGEAGSVVSEAKKWFREGGPPTGLASRVKEELGDLLWYLAAVANRLELDLDDIATMNLQKTAETWTEVLSPSPDFDSAFPLDERLPRQMAVRFVEDPSGPFPVVRMEPLGELAERVERRRAEKGLGDPLNDNAFVDDGYRFHDVIHLAHAAALGWSPVLRAIMGAKRKEGDGERDRVEDGARAIAVEEGLAAFVFNYLEPDDFQASPTDLSWDLIKHVRRSVRGLEVADLPPVAWRHAYAQAFAVFRRLRETRGGEVRVDLDRQLLTFVE
jgi:NTP pyrophosphatase (non-canonical NTP hydrolase)